MTELLPCPFCGSRDVAYFFSLHAVECQACNARGGSGGPDGASEQWNSRYFGSPHSDKASSDVLECQEPPATYEPKP